MNAVLVAIAIVLVGAIVLLWHYGHVAEEQAEEARQLVAEWKLLELSRAGTCRSLLECSARRTAIENLQQHNNFLVGRARTTDRPPKRIP